MAISLRAAGTPSGATAAVTAINPSPPAGWQSGDISILFVEVKPDTTTIATPANWTKIGEWTGGAGTLTTDQGAGKTAMFYREDSPTAPGNLSLTGADSAGAVINIYAKTEATWDVSQFTSAADGAVNQNYVANIGGSNINLDADDWLVYCQYCSSDGGTVSDEAVAATGCTFDTLVLDAERRITTGTDSALRVGHAPVLTGPSSGAPSHGYNNLQGASGHTAFLRLREVAVVAPDTPTGLNATGITTSAITLNWTASTGSPDGYDVRIDGGAPIDVGNVLSHEFTGLTPDTAYTLEVRAYNAGGDSAYATLVESTIPDTEPGDPQRDFVYQMNRLAGTLNADDVPTLDATGAANVYAGTTDQSLTGALNVAAGNTLPNYQALQGVLNQLAGTTDLAINEAAARIEA